MGCCHLLGTVRKNTFIELVQRAPRRHADCRRDRGFLHARRKARGRAARAARTRQWLLQTPADLERITYEYLQDAAAHHVRYAEFFWNPTGTVQCSGMSYAAAQQAILAGAAAAQGLRHTWPPVVPSIDAKPRPKAAVQMVQSMLDNRHEDVPGIGIDYRENERPPELFVEAYALARRNGLKTTAHASEFGLPWNNLQTAIETLKVDRVDHGYTVIDNPKLARRCADLGIVFTVVPTNSYYLRTLAPERWALDTRFGRCPAWAFACIPTPTTPRCAMLGHTRA